MLDENKPKLSFDRLTENHIGPVQHMPNGYYMLIQPPGGHPILYKGSSIPCDFHNFWWDEGDGSCDCNRRSMYTHTVYGHRSDDPKCGDDWLVAGPFTPEDVEAINKKGTNKLRERKKTMGIMIVGLDNCVSDNCNRLGKINSKASNMMGKYHDYNLLSAFDACRNKCIFDDHKGKVAIFTTRSVLYRALVEEWLFRNNIRVDYLFMRAMDDESSDTMLKQTFLKRLLQMNGVTRGDIDIAYDANSNVVGMYKQNKIHTELLQIHNKP